MGRREAGWALEATGRGGFVLDIGCRRTRTRGEHAGDGDGIERGGDTHTTHTQRHTHTVQRG